MRTLSFFSLGILFMLSIAACTDKSVVNDKTILTAAQKDTETRAIETLLDSLNTAAARAEFEKYFGYFTETATYQGTDATENWTISAFKSWAKPYFDKKRTWDFKSVQRTVTFGEHADIAWFDELLSTQMKICRGSGVVVKVGNTWKIQQYVLSMTIPNSQLEQAIKIKAGEEDKILDSLTKLTKQ